MSKDKKVAVGGDEPEDNKELDFFAKIKEASDTIDKVTSHLPKNYGYHGHGCHGCQPCHHCHCGCWYHNHCYHWPQVTWIGSPTTTITSPTSTWINTSASSGSYYV